MSKSDKKRKEVDNFNSKGLGVSLGIAAGALGGPGGMAAGALIGYMAGSGHDPRTKQRKLEDAAVEYLKDKYPGYKIKEQHYSQTGKSLTTKKRH